MKTEKRMTADWLQSLLSRGVLLIRGLHHIPGEHLLGGTIIEVYTYGSSGQIFGIRYECDEPRTNDVPIQTIYDRNTHEGLLRWMNIMQWNIQKEHFFLQKKVMGYSGHPVLPSHPAWLIHLGRLHGRLEGRQITFRDERDRKLLIDRFAGFLESLQGSLERQVGKEFKV